MNLLIIGSTGGTGRELVRQALDRGHTVTAFVRSLSHPISDLGGTEGGILKVSVGNVQDPASLSRAMENQQAVLCALGHKRWFYPNRILSDGTANIIKAMQNHGVKRLIVETALGVGDSFGRLGLYYTLFTIPFILPFYWFDKSRQERVVQASDLDWTIVRPGQLTNGPARGKINHGPKVGNYLWTVRISRADVAAFMLDQLNDSGYLRRGVGLANA